MFSSASYLNYFSNPSYIPVFSTIVELAVPPFTSVRMGFVYHSVTWDTSHSTPKRRAEANRLRAKPPEGHGQTKLQLTFRHGHPVRRRLSLKSPTSKLKWPSTQRIFLVTRFPLLSSSQPTIRGVNAKTERCRRTRGQRCWNSTSAWRFQKFIT